MKTLLIIVFLFFSCARHDANIITVNKNPKLLEETISEEEDTWTRPNNCRENIKTVVCVVDAFSDNEDAFKWQQGALQRKCTGGEDKYITELEKVYDNYPPEFQKMFCSFRKIFIEKELTSTAYASVVKYESGKLANGMFMGIRKAIIDNGMDYAFWSSWKEQLNYGGSNKEYKVSEELPMYYFEPNNDLNDFLYVVISHEFGHFFDTPNNVNVLENEKECEKKKWKNCKLKSGWPEFSWKNSSIVKEKYDFNFRHRLCFYRCSEKLNIGAVNAIYPGLSNTNFISTYGATNPWDDFAEALAYWVADKYLNAQSHILLKNGYKFDIMSHLHSNLLKEKVDFIEDLMNSPDLKYP